MTSLDRILQSEKVNSLGKASEADIARFQQVHGISLSDDFRRFLVRCNGMETTFDFDEVGEADLHMALADVNTIYGIGNGQSHADMAIMFPRIVDKGKRLEKIAPSIGVGGDSCNFVEVCQGRYAGQIMYTDGEMYWSCLDEIDWNMPVDEMIEGFIESGFFMPVADDFNALMDMYAKLV